MTGDTNADARELVLDRIIDAPRHKVYRCWTEPELLKRWFAPLPYTTPEAVLDVRSGGSCRVVMRSPDGQDMPNEGVYLEVVPNERIVFTDAYVRPWVPSDKPFFTGIITFADEGGRTRYVARARHWTREARDQHESMGFHEGWNKATDQLEAVARGL
jgi:uncharacterized protein YndB with AHSA1/START domain